MNPSANNIFNSIQVTIRPILLLWIIKLVEIRYGLSFVEYGVYPREVFGLKGIFFSPLIHADFFHLISNSFSLWVLLFLLHFFYRELYSKTIIICYFFSTVLVWLTARPSYHIGASGMVYALFAFLFISGILRKDPKMMGISLLVVFLYGSIIWGLFPIYRDISWEGHSSGALGGLICAWLFRKEGPQAPVYNWEEEEELPYIENGDDEKNFESENN